MGRKALLEETVRERTAALTESFHETVRTLGLITEKRDPYTAGHQHRVALLAMAIGEKLALTAQEIEVLKVVGLLAVPLFWRRPGALLGTALASAILLLPLVSSRALLDPASGAGQFATRWRGNESLFTRDVTIGGNAFTEEIQKQLGVSHIVSISAVGSAL